MNGILLINKEQGLTSHDVINKLRRILKMKRIGHAGTLDPMATGLLVVLVGTATKLSPYLLPLDKDYEGSVLVGVATNTEDADGEIIERKDVTTSLELNSVFKNMQGKQEQIPPMYSALKHKGKKLYELARAGKVVERKPRLIEVYELKALTDVEYLNNTANFKIFTSVSSGTYIRSLAVTIGKDLGYPAHLASLKRLRVGPFHVEDAVTLDEVEAGNYQLLNMLAAFRNDEIINVDASLNKKVKNGQPLTIADLKKDVERIILAFNNNLIGIYSQKNERYYPERVWN